MTRRMLHPWRRAGETVRAALNEAAEHVAATVNATATSTAQLTAGALILGLVAGAVLVWFGVSLTRASP